MKDANGDAAAFAAAAKQIAETSEFNIILMTENVDVMKAGIEAAGFKRPLMYAATADNADAMGELAKANDLPLAIKADSVEALVPLSDKLTGMGSRTWSSILAAANPNRPMKIRSPCAVLP